MRASAFLLLFFHSGSTDYRAFIHAGFRCFRLIGFFVSGCSVQMKASERTKRRQTRILLAAVNAAEYENMDADKDGKISPLEFMCNTLIRQVRYHTCFPCLLVFVFRLCLFLRRACFVQFWRYKFMNFLRLV